MKNVLNRIVNLYPLWIVCSSLIGFFHPTALTWFSGQWVVWALTLVMLSMGITLTIDDFRRLFKMPGSVIFGLFAHYLIMPLAGLGVARALHLSPSLSVGVILVASCPSGTASNLITYLAGANLALSVIVTMSSTLMAFIMTPVWCQLLAGQYVPVDAVGLSLSTFQVVVVPVLIGVFCNWRFPKAVTKVGLTGPILSVVAIIFIAGGIVAQSAEEVRANAGSLAIAMVALHAIGFCVGYLASRMLGFSVTVSRTISIEVGMQNGAMAAMLAKKNFPTEVAAGVPAVFSSVVQTLLGCLIAAWWRRRPAPELAPVMTIAEPQLKIDISASR